MKKWFLVAILIFPVLNVFSQGVVSVVETGESTVISWKVSWKDYKSENIKIPDSFFFTDNVYGTGNSVNLMLEGEQFNLRNLQYQTDKNVLVPVFDRQEVLLAGDSTVTFPSNSQAHTRQKVAEIHNPLESSSGKRISLFELHPWVREGDSWVYLSEISVEIYSESKQKPEPVSVKNLVDVRKKSRSLELSQSNSGFNKNEGTIFRLYFDGAGIAKIGFDDFSTLSGGDVLSGKPVANFRIFHKNSEIPVLVKDNGDGIWNQGDFLEFFTDANLVAFNNPKKDIWKSPFSDESVYYLLVGNTPSENRLGTIPGELRETIFPGDQRNLLGESFRSTIHLENNRFFESLGLRDTTKTFDYRDHWFWERVFLNEKKSFQILAPGIDGISFNPARLTVALHGLTFTGLSQLQNEHYLKLDIGNNNTAVALTNIVSGTDRWNGQELNIVSYQIEPNALQTYLGGNNASIQIQNFDPFAPTINQARHYAVNWIRLEYDRLYAAYKNQLTFTLPTGKTSGVYQFVLDNFTTPQIQIYKKGVGQINGFSTESYATGKNQVRFYRVIFQDLIIDPENTEYYAVTEDVKKAPLKVEKVNPSVLLDKENPSLKSTERTESMIILTASEFWNPGFASSSFSPVLKYAQNRETSLNARIDTDSRFAKRDKQVLVTTIKDVYDEFSGGYETPYAIREFIRYAVLNWKRPPLYVLILGDANHSYTGDFNYVPTMLIQTTHLGSVASDVWFSMVAGNDIIPDVSIGRIPARTTSEIQAYLDKMIDYDNESGFSGWHNNVLYISGFEESFITDNDSIRASTDKSIFSDVLHVKEREENDPFFGGKIQLINYWNKGQLVVNFMGHGGGGIWADRGLFDIPDVDRLQASPRLPFVSSLTCFTGSFSEPSNRVSLAEKLILTDSKGAIGVFASSGVGWKLNNLYFGRALFRFMVNPDFHDLAIGDILNISRFYYRARISDYANYPFRIPTSQIYQYNLFGDPSVLLKQVNTKLDLAKPVQTITSNDSITVSFSSGIISEGQAKLKFADNLNRDLLNSENLTVDISGGTGSGSFKIPQSLRGKSGFLKIYASDNETDGTGVIRFSYSNVSVVSVSSFPGDLVNNVPLKLQFVTDSKVQLDSGTVFIEVIDQATDAGIIGGFGKLSSSSQSGILYSNTFKLAKTGNNNWVTRDSIPGEFVNSNYSVRYLLKLYDTSLRVYEFSGNWSAGLLPDIAAAPQNGLANEENYTNSTIGIYNKNGAVLGAEVFNYSEKDIENVKIRMFGQGVQNGFPPSFSGIPLLLGELITTLPRNSSEMIFFPLPPDTVMETGKTYNMAVQVITDTTDGFREQSYTNNLSNPVQIKFNVYTIEPSKKTRIIQDDYSVDFRQMFSSVRNVILEYNIGYQIPNQPQLKSEEMTSFKNGVIQIKSFNEDETVTGNTGKISANYPGSIDGPDGRLSWYYFDNRSANWLRLESSVDTLNQTISAEISEFGMYKLFFSSDLTPPTVQISSNGILLDEDAVFPSKGQFAILVQDENGVNRKSESYQIKINNEILPADQLSIPDTLPDGNQILVTFSKYLPEGTHSISYTILDSDGNQASVEELTFKVSVQEIVDFYGGFPNPFSRYQIFTFYLGNVADKVQLKIYTVSGRLVNTFDSSELNPDSFIPDQNFAGLNIKTPGTADQDIYDYMEIYWDGTDREGIPVAYGVYYVKLIVKYPGKTVEKVFKTVRADR